MKKTIVRLSWLIQKIISYLDRKIKTYAAKSYLYSRGVKDVERVNIVGYVHLWIDKTSKVLLGAGVTLADCVAYGNPAKWKLIELPKPDGAEISST